MTSKRVIITGAGFSGMSLAANLAKKGFDVEIFEKNESPGGKVRQYIHEGFTFDIGASIYFYPDIFERFFNSFNHSVTDFYKLHKLDPSYRIFFSAEDYFDIPASDAELLAICDELELNGKKKMVQYLEQAGKYHFLLLEDIIRSIPFGIKKGFRYSRILPANSARKHQRYIRNLFKSYKIISLLEFPLPFFGSIPIISPIFPFAVNYSILKKGIFYPEGGIHQVEEALSAILEELKVSVHLSSEVKHFDIIDDSISGILTQKKNFHADLFASAMDYFHTEQLIGKNYSNYPAGVWRSKSKYPSILLFFLGFKKKLQKLMHHNLILSDCFDLPKGKGMKSKSNYKASISFITCTSKTDSNKAPDGMENLVARITLPPGLEDTGKMREHYFLMLLARLEDITGQSLKSEIILKKSFAMNDFEHEYYSYKGQAFGAMHAIRASMLMKPRVKNKHLSNLYYTEIPNVLGPGIASALLSGEMVANTIINDCMKIYD